MEDDIGGQSFEEKVTTGPSNEDKQGEYLAAVENKLNASGNELKQCTSKEAPTDIQKEDWQPDYLVADPDNESGQVNHLAKGQDMFQLIRST